MLYLSESLIGDGSLGNPYRPEGSLEHPKASWIYLGETGRSLLWLPILSRNKKIMPLALDKNDVPGREINRILGNKLGLTIDSRLTRAKDVVAQILLTSDKGWKTLTPTNKKVLEYYIGGELWWLQQDVSGGATASSDFSGPDENPLSEGGVWDMQYGGTARVSGHARGFVGNGFGRRNSPTLTSNHYSQVKLGASFTRYAGPTTRCQSASNANCYAAFANDSSSLLQLYRVTDSGTPSYTLMSDYNGITIAPTDNVRLISNGSSHQVFVNDNRLGIPVIDTTYTGGQPGYVSNPADAADSGDISDWEAGDLPQVDALYVMTSSTSGGSGLEKTTSGINRAYPSLASAMASFGLNEIADPPDIFCFGATPDIGCTQSSMQFHTTGNPIRVIGDNDSGEWSEDHYRIEVVDEDGIYNNTPSHIQLINVQVKVTITEDAEGDLNCFRLATANNGDEPIAHVYDGTIAWINYEEGATVNCFGYIDSHPSGNTGTCKRINAFVFQTGNPSNGAAGFSTDESPWAEDNVLNFNTTARSCRFNYLGLQVCVNCIGADSRFGEGGDFLSTGSSGHSNNASTTGTAPGANPQSNAVITWVDANSDNGNPHISPADTGVLGLGLVDPEGSGEYTHDIDGEERGLSWSIGCDQPSAARKGKLVNSDVLVSMTSSLIG